MASVSGEGKKSACVILKQMAAGMGIFEVLNGAASPETLARHLSVASRNYYGTPIREYLAQLSRQRQRVLEVLAELRKASLRGMYQPTLQVKYGARPSGLP